MRGGGEATSVAGGDPAGAPASAARLRCFFGGRPPLLARSGCSVAYMRGECVAHVGHSPLDVCVMCKPWSESPLNVLIDNAACSSSKVHRPAAMAFFTSADR